MSCDPDEEDDPVRAMAERMLAQEHLAKHCDPNYVDPHRAQAQWDADYEAAKGERRERQYLAWLRHQKEKLRRR